MITYFIDFISFKILEALFLKHLPLFHYKNIYLATNKTLGLICEKRSTKPLTPKSGEQDDHISS